MGVIFALLAGAAAQAPARAQAAKPQAKAAKPAAPKPAAPANALAVKPGAGDEPTTTEIYADNAFFDSNKGLGIFDGHVRVLDPRFNIQSDKLTVYISHEENQGLEKAVAEGNVAVVRDRPDPKGGAPVHSVGRSDTAVYTAKDGNVELSGNPRVQQGPNTHVAMSPTTVMILNNDGQLVTHGPSRTEIRQETPPEPPKP